MKRMTYRLLMGLVLGVVVCSVEASQAHADEWSKTYTLTGKPDLRVETSDATFMFLRGIRKRSKPR